MSQNSIATRLLRMRSRVESFAAVVLLLAAFSDLASDQVFLLAFIVSEILELLLPSRRECNVKVQDCV